MSLIERLLHKNQGDNKKQEANGGSESVPADVPPTEDAPPEPLPEYGAADPDYQEMLREMEAIQDIIGDESGTEEPVGDEVQIDMTLAQVLDLLPPPCRSADISGIDLDETVKVSVVDPYGQLATGRVAVDLFALVKNVPPGLLSAEVDQHFGDSVPIPLAKVVAAVSPEELQRRTVKDEREPDIYNMPDVFDPSAAAPAAPREQAPEAATAAPQPEPVTAETETTPVEPEPAVVETAPAETPRPMPAAAATTTAPRVMVGTVDINSASVDELLVGLKGATRSIAERIVAHRPYPTPFHLGRVPGVGKKLFRSFTGLHLPGRSLDLDAVEQVLTGPDGKLPTFEVVAQRVADLSGVAGCILSHADGYLLAAAWRRGKVQTIGAIAPQIFKHVGKYFDLLQMSAPDSITLYVDPRPVFITRQGDIFMIVVMPRTRATGRRLEFLEVLGAELVRRWKRRPASTI